MTIVYELLKRMFILENLKKKNEIVINYYGMLVFFGKREFVIVTGLKCHPPLEHVPWIHCQKRTMKKKQRSKRRSRTTFTVN